MHAAVETRYGAVLVSEKGRPWGIGSGVGMTDWALQTELSHELLLTECVAFLWMGRAWMAAPDSILL